MHPFFSFSSLANLCKEGFIEVPIFAILSSLVPRNSYTCTHTFTKKVFKQCILKVWSVLLCLCLLHSNLVSFLGWNQYGAGIKILQVFLNDSRKTQKKQGTDSLILLIFFRFTYIENFRFWGFEWCRLYKLTLSVTNQSHFTLAEGLKYSRLSSHWKRWCCRILLLRGQYTNPPKMLQLIFAAR